MGVRIEQNNDEIQLNFSSDGGSIRQTYNIYKMVKDSKKTVIANFDYMQPSTGSLIMNFSKYTEW